MPVQGPGPRRSGYPAGLTAYDIPSHVAAREWALGSVAARSRSHLLVLSGGDAEIASTDSNSIYLAAPSLVWLPPASANRLEVRAGSSGRLLSMDTPSLRRNFAPSVEACFECLAERRSLLVVPVDPMLAEAIARSIGTMVIELAEPGLDGADSIVYCELTLIVLRIWRQLNATMQLDAGSNVVDVLRSFKQLLEERYREHLSVAAYAMLLGITPDRLHGICTRELRHSPIQLIQQRLMQEATLRLETTGASIKQLAFALGFKDTAYFNRFFRKHAGAPPARWRRALKVNARGSREIRYTFADWP